MRANGLIDTGALLALLDADHRVEDCTGVPTLVAYARFRSEALPGFGGMTAGQLVREGNAHMVRAHLDRIMAGGYA